VLCRAKGQWNIVNSHASVLPRHGAAPIHEIDFDFATRQPIVRARVDGGRAVPFLVDTGASINIIDEHIAREAGVATGRSRELRGGGEGRVTAMLGGPLRLEIDDIAWAGQRASIVNLGYPQSKHFAGILGAPILKRYTVQFDFNQRKLRLFDPADYSAPHNAVVVPFELQDDLPIVHVAVDAGGGPIDARLMVDTGASQFVELNRPFVDAHGLVQLVTDAAVIQQPAGLGGSAPVAYGTGRRVTLAGLSFDTPRLGLSRAMAGSSTATDRDGILGNDLLRRFRVTVDYLRRVLVLEQ
jgi:predicted aspartyl protease